MCLGPEDPRGRAWMGPALTVGLVGPHMRAGLAWERPVERPE